VGLDALVLREVGNRESFAEKCHVVLLSEAAAIDEEDEGNFVALQEF
jgi:hypothetical protein